jgi:cytochrome c biogenesis protein CcdA
VLGVIVILTAGAFGAINSTAWFNVGIAMLFVFLGLAMFDVFSLDFHDGPARFIFPTQSRDVPAGIQHGRRGRPGGACGPGRRPGRRLLEQLYASGARTAHALPFVLESAWPCRGQSPAPG